MIIGKVMIDLLLFFVQFDHLALFIILNLNFNGFNSTEFIFYFTFWLCNCYGIDFWSIDSTWQTNRIKTIIKLVLKCKFDDLIIDFFKRSFISHSVVHNKKRILISFSFSQWNEMNSTCSGVHLYVSKCQRPCIE